MVIDISIKAAALFVIQMICWLGICSVSGLIVYYTDDPSPPSKLRHATYALIVLVSFVLIFGLVQINWLP